MTSIFFAGAIGVGVALSMLMGAFTWTTREPTVVEKPGFGDPIGLGTAVIGFYRYLFPWLLSMGVLALWIGRMLVGPWTDGDWLVLIGVIIAWPFLEWGTHVLEHRMPVVLLGRTIEPVIARTHRAHHQNPWNPKYGITTLHNVPVLFLVMPAAWLLALPTGPALTGAAATLTLFLTYEWVHYLTHTSYRPVGPLYKRLYANHRCHHFRNDDYWFGVTTLVGDRLLRTGPRYRDVQSSETCHELLRLARDHARLRRAC